MYPAFATFLTTIYPIGSEIIIRLASKCYMTNWAYSIQTCALLLLWLGVWSKTGDEEFVSLKNNLVLMLPFLMFFGLLFQIIPFFFIMLISHSVAKDIGVFVFFSGWLFNCDRHIIMGKVFVLYHLRSKSRLVVSATFWSLPSFFLILYSYKEVIL